MRKRKENKKKSMSPEETMAFINKSLGYKTLLKPTKYWLDTGFPRLNAVMGSRKRGLGSGKIYLVAGEESSGKSALVAKLAAIAQKQGCDVGWVDGENSYDPDHVRRQGLHSSRVTLFTPEYGEFKLGKKSKASEFGEVEPAEYLFTRVELWMKIRRKQNPNGKLFLAVDSTNSFSPKEELEAGYVDANMRTKASPAVFLNALNKRLAPLAVHTNAIIFLIAQLRTNPGKMFGDPKYISGGGGLKYFPHSINWMRRVKDGAIKKGDKQIGVRGLISNKKNKVGGDSIERKKCGYLAYFYKDAWKFISQKKIKGEV